MEFHRKHILAPLLEITGQADRVRKVYHRLVQPFKICTFEMGERSSKFWVPSRTHEMSIRYFTEQKQLECFLKFILPGDVVWDVGANMGVYSIFAAKRIHKKGKIYAFEPESKIRKILKVNCLINGVGSEVTVLPLALGKYTGTTTFFESSVDIGTHSVLRRYDNHYSKPKGRKVKIARADAVVKTGKVKNPDVIKIDVEGAEYDVCDGLRNLFKSRPPKVIFCEVHPTLIGNFGHSAEDLRDLLTKNNYVIDDFGKRGTEYYWIAKNNCTTELT